MNEVLYYKHIVMHIIKKRIYSTYITTLDESTNKFNKQTTNAWLIRDKQYYKY